LYNIGQEIYACGETPYFYEISPTLETLERNHTLKAYGQLAVSSHFQKDQKTGDIYTMGTATTMSASMKYNVLKMTADCMNKKLDKRFEVVCSIPSRWRTCTTYLHSFGMTENYLIFIEQPMVLHNLKVAAIKLKGYCLNDCAEWLQDEKNKFCIVNKKSGKVVQREIYAEQPFFFMHFSNCFEQDGHVSNKSKTLMLVFN